jgi:hypothetical protein
MTVTRDPGGRRPLFRPSALEHYVRSQERAVLPRLVRPGVFGSLWVLFALVAVGAAGAWHARVPAWARGTAVVLAAGADGAPTVAAFFPPAAASALRPGAALVLEGEAGEALHARVRSVEPGVLAPREAARRFALEGAGAAAARAPRAVALAALDSLPALPAGAAAWEGSVFPARVRVGERRVLSLLLGRSGW